MTRFAVDALWRRSSDERGLLAGSPPVWWSVTDAGARILDAIEAGVELSTGHAPLTDRLLAGGAIHPVDVPSAAVSEITVVVPALVASDDAHRRLADLVDAVAPLSVVVVDDGSPTPITLDNAIVLRHDSTQGPGAARNTGLATVTTPIVAFIDADATVSAADICRLAGHLADRRVALVAPRVAAEHGSRHSWYDATRSPLDLGNHRALVRPLSRVSYVPSTVIVCRVDAVRATGCFDESLRWGEDVDLVWRMVGAGHWCRYEPDVVAQHEVRRSFVALVHQRFRYGSSAGALAERHGGLVAPFRAGLATSLTVAALLSGWWPAALALGVISTGWHTVSLTRRGLAASTGFAVSSAALARALHQASVATARAWWPIAAVASMFTWRGIPALVAAVVVPPTVSAWRTRPPLSRLPLWWLLHVVDDAAYSAGVWWGAVRTAQRGSLRCLLPTVTLPRPISERRRSAR